MTKEISALVDGEQDAGEEQAIFSAIRHDESLRRRCCEYQLIGEALRREQRLDREIAVAVMSAVRNEPTILAPKPVRVRQPWHRPMLAMAATVAGVAVVGWVAFGPHGAVGPSLQTAPVAVKRVPAMQSAQLAQARVPAGTVQSATPAHDLTSYMTKHRERSGTLVSVFAEPLAGQREMPESGDFSMGGVNVHRRVVGDQVLVVMGEVPTANLRRIGDGIVTAQK